MPQTYATAEITIPAGEVRLRGDLVRPANPQGLVVFAHGSGSSRLSPRNRYVAQELNEANLATLLFDLLTEDEERSDQYTGLLRFDIPLLAERLATVTGWVEGQDELRYLPLGYFGASTGAGAALMAAGSRPESILAVVSRGGRPDLAGEALPRVRAATLLIIGALDAEVIELNRAAYERLGSEKQIAIVPGATHLFEEPGTLEQAARLARDWFKQHLSQVAPTGKGA